MATYTYDIREVCDSANSGPSSSERGGGSDESGSAAGGRRSGSRSGGRSGGDGGGATAASMGTLRLSGQQMRNVHSFEVRRGDETDSKAC